MAGFKTHLIVLQRAAQDTPSLLALKIPHMSLDGELQGWTDITCSQLLHDVERSARYWSRKLLKKEINTGSVIGLWLKGTTYLDLLHIWGISRAGYVPQLISAHLTSSTVVRQLLNDAKAKGLIHDPAILVSVGEDVATFPAADFLGLAVEQFPLAEVNSPKSGHEIIFILHSCGSTSGKPTLVPATARWLDCNMRKTKHVTFRGPGAEYQETNVASGSFCHVANALGFMSYLNKGSCMTLPTLLPYSLPELRKMVRECRVTVLNMFSSFLADVTKAARKDPELLAILQSFDACTCGGLPLDENKAAWAREQGINLVELFASTEVGCMMIGVGGRHGKLLRMWPGSTFEMRPISVALADTSLRDAANIASRGTLVELVVPKYAPECPHPSLCDQDTGDFSTGDIFLQVEPDLYISMGRNDDWIKMENSLRCDTRSIENNALEVCGKDLITAAVVVGAARPAPALVVEAKQTEDYGELQTKILHRITPFHERRYKHERILDSRLIVIVPNGAIPRTAKGSMQRKVAKKEFKEDLDRIYSEVYLRK
ncbi:acetyl synthetase [Fusarium subglutinans]|uniref:Acetyl synthetase n=1 Tax=Gibberella subglutinans TaxID=42677 RepID=A0A8H5PY45_GIBSU|nr:acetyl synthetase [Fusarium subglutinans]KAF5604268.1 acetyl synthetase [Fusarium subglutinans]